MIAELLAMPCRAVQPAGSPGDGMLGPGDGEMSAPPSHFTKEEVQISGRRPEL
jgi:hypothetical protein